MTPAPPANTPSAVANTAKTPDATANGDRSSVLSPHRRILELDGLRALAALSLVAFHLTHVYSEKYGFRSPLPFVWHYGAYGTEMFFILSGFVNSMSLLRRGRPVDFVAARLIRIVPLFLLVIVTNVFLLRMTPMQTPVSITTYAANLTLMPKVFGAECLDPVMWTLQIEMLFYATIVTLYCLGGTRRYFIGWGTLLMASMVVCPTLDHFEATHGDAWWFSLATGLRLLMVLDFVPLFAIGFMIYMIKTKTGRFWQNMLAIVVAAGVFHAIDHGKHNPAATVLLIGLVAAAAYGKVPPLRIRPLIHISTISYALYLCHNNLGCVLIHRLDQSGVPSWATLVAAAAMAWSISVIVTERVEGPMTKWLRSRWEAFRQRPMKVTPAGRMPRGAF